MRKIGLSGLRKSPGVGAPGPAFSERESMCTNESNDHEVDATTDRCIRYYDTGDGHLVFRVRLEYHPKHDRWFPIEHELIGVSGVEDRSVIREILQELGMTCISVRHLPKYSLEDHLGRRDPD